MAEQKQRQGVRFTVFIVIIVLLYTIPRMVSFLMTESVNYVIAKPGSIQETTSMQGVITREEYLYDSVSAGVVEYYYPGTKALSKNTVVCTIRDTSYYGEILDQKLEDVYSEISKVNNNEYASAFAEMEEEVNEQIVSYMRVKDNSIYGSVYALKDSLQSNVQRRQDLYSLFSGSQVQKLLEEQGIYQQVVDESSDNLWISEAGIIAYSYDGYEGWDWSMIEENYMETYDSSYQYLDINMSQVKQGEPLYRLVTSQNWYITMFISEEYALSLNEVSSISFSCDGSEPLRGYIYALEEAGEDSYKLVLEVRSRVHEFLDKRIVTLTMDEGTYEGIKVPDACLIQEAFHEVPLSCVFMSNKEDGLMVRSDKGDVFMDINFEWKTETHAYFALPETLNVGAILLQQNAEETVVLGSNAFYDGVYVINAGSQDYQHIEILHQENGYSIITGIEAYDHVMIPEKSQEGGLK